MSVDPGRRLTALACVVVCALAFSATASAQTARTAEWPDYRGPRRDGVVEGTLPLRWSETEGVRWKTAIEGRGWSTPFAK